MRLQPSIASTGRWLLISLGFLAKIFPVAGKQGYLLSEFILERLD